MHRSNAFAAESSSALLENSRRGFYTPEDETNRQVVNKFIRTSGAFDAAIDFDEAVRDPSHPPVFCRFMIVGPRDGWPYDNTYTWYFQMREAKVVKVVAFFDTRDFDELWTRVSLNRLPLPGWLDLN